MSGEAGHARHRAWRLVMIGLGLCLPVWAWSWAPTSSGPLRADELELGPTREISERIRRGVDWLKVHAHETGGDYGRGLLMALTLVKAGESPESSVVKPIVDSVRTRVKEGVYVPANAHYGVYESAVAAMLMGSADLVAYRTEIEAISRFLIREQHATGGWDYPERKEKGDTSVSQYGVLGLWEAARAGIEVPRGVWQRAAAWHLRTQRLDGGFHYHPDEGGEVRHTMTAAGTGSLLVCRRHLFPDQKDVPVSEPDPVAATPSRRKRRFGVLEQGPVEPPAAPVATSGRAALPAPNVPLASLNTGIDRGLNWLQQNFRTRFDGGIPLEWANYFYYGMERLGALSGKTHLGEHDWYEEIAETLGQTQSPDGHWVSGSSGLVGTSFAVLFLIKSTAKLVTPIQRKPTFGAGVLVGGRGLPDDLSTARLGAGGVEARKTKTPVEELLAQLENPAVLDVESGQTELVEQVSTEQIRALVGQKERLLKLARDRRPEVRRTAFWALGRSNDLTVAPVLIEGLLDSEAECVVEARNALQFLGRRPVAEPPTDEPTEAQKQAAHKAWRTWYLSVRPYAERDDLGKQGRE
jgi:hypothetical protein